MRLKMGNYDLSTYTCLRTGPSEYRRAGEISRRVTSRRAGDVYGIENDPEFHSGRTIKLATLDGNTTHLLP